MDQLLDLRRELLNAVDNRKSTKEDLVKAIESVSTKLLLLYQKS
jgi:hypothetical protein